MYVNFFKRLFDILFSIIGLLLFLPIFLIVAPIIWLNDRGPIFYVARRLGKNGKTFKMYKFRTMIVNAPDIRNKDGSTFNSDNDPRLTKIGGILRKTSIDELPQLINVFVGDMSFIGPRPMLELVGNNKIRIDMKTKKIMTVLPGITGYSQAFFRNSISQEEKKNNDLFYVENISFKLDIKIFFRTIYSVLKRQNINIE